MTDPPTATLRRRATDEETTYYWIAGLALMAAAKVMAGPAMSAAVSAGIMLGWLPVRNRVGMGPND